MAPLNDHRKSSVELANSPSMTQQQQNSTAGEKSENGRKTSKHEVVSCFRSGGSLSIPRTPPKNIPGMFVPTIPTCADGDAKDELKLRFRRGFATVKAANRWKKPPGPKPPPAKPPPPPAPKVPVPDAEWAYHPPKPKVCDRKTVLLRSASEADIPEGERFRPVDDSSVEEVNRFKSLANLYGVAEFKEHVKPYGQEEFELSKKPMIFLCHPQDPEVDQGGYFERCERKRRQDRFQRSVSFDSYSNHRNRSILGGILSSKLSSSTIKETREDGDREENPRLKRDAIRRSKLYDDELREDDEDQIQDEHLKSAAMGQKRSTTSKKSVDNHRPRRLDSSGEEAVFSSEEEEDKLRGRVLSKSPSSEVSEPSASSGYSSLAAAASVVLRTPRWAMTEEEKKKDVQERRRQRFSLDADVDLGRWAKYSSSVCEPDKDLEDKKASGRRETSENQQLPSEENVEAEYRSCSKHSKCHCYLFALPDTSGFYAMR